MSAPEMNIEMITVKGIKMKAVIVKIAWMIGPINIHFDSRNSQLLKKLMKVM